MSKASRTVPVGGEMLHETWLLCVGATVMTGAVGSTTGTWKVYLVKAGSFCPAKREGTHIGEVHGDIWKWCIRSVHGHYQRTIGDHGDVVQCVPGHFEMFTFYDIRRLAVLPLSQWPSPCSQKTFSRSILWKTSQWVWENSFYQWCYKSEWFHILPVLDPQRARLQRDKSERSSVSASHCRSRQLERNYHNCRNIESQTFSQEIFIFQGHFHLLRTWWWHQWTPLGWLWCILKQHQV